MVSATHTSQMDDSDQSDIIKKIKTSGAEAEGDDEGGDLDLGDEPTDDGADDGTDFGGDSELEETDTLLGEEGLGFDNDVDNWEKGDTTMWENKIQEGLSKLKKNSTFVIKEDMNEPQTQPDIDTDVEVEPQRRTRKKTTWSPNVDEPQVNPDIDPKATSSIDSMDTEGEGMINDEIVEV